MENQIAIGIDCGGTNFRAARIENDHIASEIISEPTPQNIDEFNRMIDNLAERLKPSGWSGINVGLSVPGMVDYHNNKIFHCPNLKYLSQIPAQDINDRHPIHLGNDADMSLLGELVIDNLWKEDVALVTLGTGVGSSYYIDKIGPWQSNLQSEIGHSKVDLDGEKCSCGELGCLETHFSGWSLISRAIKSDLAIKSVEELFNRARDGDPKASEIIMDGTRYLGIALANLVNVIGVNKIIITGKIALSFDILSPNLDKFFSNNLFLPEFRKVEIKQSTNIDKAPLVGASYHALNSTK